MVSRSRTARRRRRALALLSATAVLAVACTPSPPQAGPPPESTGAATTAPPTDEPGPGQHAPPDPTAAPPRPGDSAPQYSYDEAIREHVLVPFDHDLDGDGDPDHVSLDIIRPDTEPGEVVPVIMVSSVYFFRAGRGPEQEVKAVGSDGLVQHLPLFWDNYFVPRGYAVVAMDNPGTGRSTGCMDVLGPSDLDGAAAAVSYLAGLTPGTTPEGDQVEAEWSSGQVAMAGKSYDGSVASGLAQRGTPGLTTVITESGLSDTYEYARPGGMIRYPGWLRWYSEGYHSPEQTRACEEFLTHVDAETADDTGDRTPYWVERDVISDLSSWQAPTLITHGLTDWNVLPQQGTDLFEGLQAQDVPVQMWLSQSGHESLFDVRRHEYVEHLELWLDHWLLGHDNGVMDLPAVQVEDAQQLGTWGAQPTWPLPHTPTAYLLTSDSERGGLVAEADQDAEASRESVTFEDLEEFSPWATVPETGEHHGGGLYFVSDEQAEPLQLSGAPLVRIQVEVDGVDRAPLSVKLVDIGEADRLDPWAPDGPLELGPERDCFGQEPDGGIEEGCFLVAQEAIDQTPQGLIAQAWLDLGHADSREQGVLLDAGEVVEVELALSPVQTTIEPGHRLALIVHGTDRWFTVSYTDPCDVGLGDQNPPCAVPTVDGVAQYTVATGASELVLPVVDSSR